LSNPPTGGYFFAWYLMGTTYAPQALWYSWMADLTAHDLQLRAITTGFMNSFDFAFVTWWPLIFFPVTDAPDYHKGYIASLVTGTLTVPVILAIAYLEKLGRKKGVIGRPVEEEEGLEGRNAFSSPVNASGSSRKGGAVADESPVKHPEQSSKDLAPTGPIP
jgi:MFS transporter, ACS family, pantothenate transporter